MSSDAYKPPLKEYCALLREYALSGMRFFSNLEEGLVLKIERSLKGHIERHEQKLTHKFSEAHKGRPVDFGFIPAPRSESNQFAVAFFMPKFAFGKKGKFACSFNILLWIDDNDPAEADGKTVAFRLDPPDSPQSNRSSPHCYSHIQLSPKVLRPELNTSLSANWVPSSYPAFPIYHATPVAFFATLTTSVHGYDPATERKYAIATLTDAIKDANRKRKVLTEIDRLMNG